MGLEALWSEPRACAPDCQHENSQVAEVVAAASGLQAPPSRRHSQRPACGHPVQGLRATWFSCQGQGARRSPARTHMDMFWKPTLFPWLCERGIMWRP